MDTLSDLELEFWSAYERMKAKEPYCQPRQNGRAFSPCIPYRRTEHYEANLLELVA